MDVLCRRLHKKTNKKNTGYTHAKAAEQHNQHEKKQMCQCEVNEALELLLMATQQVQPD